MSQGANEILARLEGLCERIVVEGTSGLSPECNRLLQEATALVAREIPQNETRKKLILWKVGA